MRSLRLLAVAVLAVAAAQEEEEEGDFKSENARRRDEAAKYTYCEEDNCYDLLGVKQTSLAFAIKRAYRRLAAEWHPDKNPDPMAREKFQKFANAYSVLADTEMRANYDYLLEHPMEFPMHFMRFGSGQYAPKTDPRVALALCVLLVSAMQYVYRHQTRANLLASAKQAPSETPLPPPAPSETLPPPSPRRVATWPRGASPAAPSLLSRAASAPETCSPQLQRPRAGARHGPSNLVLLKVTPVREGETIEGSRTMRNRPYPVLKCSRLRAREP